MFLWPVWLCLLTSSLRTTLAVGTVNYQERMLRVNVSMECSPDLYDFSVININEVVDPSKPYIMLIQVYCIEGLSVFTQRDGTISYKYMAYPELSNYGVLNTCTFAGPYPTNDQPSLNRYDTFISIHWSDYEFTTVNVTCVHNQYVTSYTTTTYPPTITVLTTGLPSPTLSSTRFPTDVTPDVDYELNYIIEVVPHCGTSNNVEQAWIEIVTDLHLSAIAICKDGPVTFNSSDTVNFFLPVFYDPAKAAPGSCLFEKRVNSAVYNIRVEISWGERVGHVHTKENYQVTCTFDLHSGRKSMASSSSKRLIAPKEIQTNLGPDATSAIQLRAVDVLHQIIDGFIPLGRTIRLEAASDGVNGEFGLRPISCDVIGVNSAERYAILRAGCGDGIIFPKDTGFKITNRIARSPYFQAFNLFHDSQITFECNFTLCMQLCDGNSCTSSNGRKKRYADFDPGPAVSLIRSINTRQEQQSSKLRNDKVLNRTETGENNTALDDNNTALDENNTALSENDTALGENDKALGENDLVICDNVTISSQSIISPSNGLSKISIGLVVCLGSVVVICIFGCLLLFRFPTLSKNYKREYTIS